VLSDADFIALLQKEATNEEIGQKIGKTKQLVNYFFLKKKKRIEESTRYKETVSKWADTNEVVLVDEVVINYLPWRWTFLYSKRKQTWKKWIFPVPSSAVLQTVLLRVFFYGSVKQCLKKELGITLRKNHQPLESCLLAYFFSKASTEEIASFLLLKKGGEVPLLTFKSLFLETGKKTKSVLVNALSNNKRNTLIDTGARMLCTCLT